MAARKSVRFDKKFMQENKPGQLNTQGDNGKDKFIFNFTYFQIPPQSNIVDSCLVPIDPTLCVLLTHTTSGLPVTRHGNKKALSAVCFALLS